MIRFFTGLCKTILENFSDEAIFWNATEAFSHYGAKCPACGANGKMSEYGNYSRYLVSFNGDERSDHSVSPRRFKCAACGTTHALLPDILIPYSSYSLRFKLSVLIAYFERKMTVEAICKRFDIAVSTLYAWKEWLLEHKELLLGVLENLKEPVITFLQNLLDSAHISEHLRSFFNRNAFSFLQNKSVTTTPSIPP